MELGEKKFVSFGIYERKSPSLKEIESLEELECLYQDDTYYDSSILYFGSLYGLKGKEEEWLSFYKAQQKERYEALYQKISAPLYMENIVKIMNEYERLNQIVSKYRRRRLGNKDVYALHQFLKAHEEEIMNARFDIAVSSVLVLVSKDEHSEKDMFLEKNPNATKEERKEYMRQSMHYQMEQELWYFKSDLKEAHDNYENFFMKKLKELLKEKKELFLLALPGAFKGIKKKIKIDAFTFEDYMKGECCFYQVVDESICNI